MELIFIVLALVVLAVQIVVLAVKAAWGITKIVLCVLGAPLLVLVLLLVGLSYLAVPLLVVALLAVFLAPLLKG